MGRFSPTVQPVPDTGLANALGNFVESYMQASSRRKDHEQQDRQFDAEMLRTGYRPQSQQELAGALANQAQPLVPGGQPHKLPGMQISDPTQRASLAHALSMDESGNELLPRQGPAPVQIGDRSYIQTDDARATAEEHRQRAALAAELTGAQIGNYQSEADLRRYTLAHPKATPELRPRYDSQRGVLINPDGSVTVPEGLPPLPPRSRGGRSGVSSDSQDVHRGVFVDKQLSDTNAEIRAAEKVVSAGLPRRATATDSASFNAARSAVSTLRPRADSLRGVISEIGAHMAGQTGRAAPAGAEDPTAGLSDADAWEYHVEHGLSKQEATARVRARHRR
jgi:hypothetical protein